METLCFLVTLLASCCFGKDDAPAPPVWTVPLRMSPSLQLTGRLRVGPAWLEMGLDLKTEGIRVFESNSSARNPTQRYQPSLSSTASWCAPDSGLCLYVSPTSGLTGFSCRNPSNDPPPANAFFRYSGMSADAGVFAEERAEGSEEVSIEVYDRTFEGDGFQDRSVTVTETSAPIRLIRKMKLASPFSDSRDLGGIWGIGGARCRTPTFFDKLLSNLTRPNVVVIDAGPWAAPHLLNATSGEVVVPGASTVIAKLEIIGSGGDGDDCDGVGPDATSRVGISESERCRTSIHPSLAGFEFAGSSQASVVALENRWTFQILELDVCGHRILGTVSRHWTAMIDPRSRCVTIPKFAFRNFAAWLPLDCPKADHESSLCFVDARRPLPALSFRLSASGEVFKLPLESLVIWDVEAKRNRLCLLPEETDDYDGVYPTTFSPPINFGLLALQSLKVAYNSRTRAVGFAPSIQHDFSDESCAAPIQCIGSQTFVEALNSCKDPRCSLFFFKQLNAETKTCEVSLKVSHAFIVAVLFLLFAEMLPYILRETSMRAAKAEILRQQNEALHEPGER